MEKLNIKELINLCKERNITGYSGLRKEQIKLLITEASQNAENPVMAAKAVKTVKAIPTVKRLNYIGSKYQLLDWLISNIKEKTGFDTLANKKIADLFAGTGIVSHQFRLQGASVQSNDAELYSSIIVHAFTCSTYSSTCETLIATLQKELLEKRYENTTGFITDKYSPQGEAQRKFFTIDNAKKIDYVRARLEELKPTLDEDDYKFLLASLLLSADAVSNVPAVYGCFLHNFKTKATKSMVLSPAHTHSQPSKAGSKTFNADILTLPSLLKKTDIVYLDPPYNNRQYSKNYFPLNMMALSPEDQAKVPPLKGKTGIPEACFMSPFCKKDTVVEEAFDTLFKNLKTKWIFLSYNSESTVKKEKLLALMSKYGQASVVERDYKRFKSYDYNKDVQIKEYLFCLCKF